MQTAAPVAAAVDADNEHGPQRRLLQRQDQLLTLCQHITQPVADGTRPQYAASARLISVASTVARRPRRPT